MTESPSRTSVSVLLVEDNPGDAALAREALEESRAGHFRVSHASALGYSMAAMAIIIDVGRPWLIWAIPIGGFPDMFRFNWNSALLEVALCVMAYVGVLWIELSPAFMEKWRDTSKNEGLKKLSVSGLKFLDKAMIWIIALGVLLPTMHQSSLGTVMLLAGQKLHGLWFTGWIPLLFLIYLLRVALVLALFRLIG